MNRAIPRHSAPFRAIHQYLHCQRKLVQYDELQQQIAELQADVAAEKGKLVSDPNCGV